MNKTLETRKAYLERGSRLWFRAARDLEIPAEQLTPSAYLKWLESLLPQLRPTSRRQYLAATREWLSADQDGCLSSIVGRECLQKALRQSQCMEANHYSLPQDQNKPWKGKTSAQKSKRLDVAVLASITRKQGHRTLKWFSAAILWMSANTLVGLRPCEWRQAELEKQDGQHVLKVRNAKNTNGRAHGTYRHLNLEEMDETSIRLIRRQLMEVEKHVGSEIDWQRYCNGVRKAIYRMMRENLPQRRRYPTLYSSRHQFAANAKSSGMAKNEIAALMGHATDDTASEHYGRSRHGRGWCPVKPNADEVQRVRAVGHKLNPKGPRK